MACRPSKEIEMANVVGRCAQCKGDLFEEDWLCKRCGNRIPGMNPPRPNPDDIIKGFLCEGCGSVFGTEMTLSAHRARSKH